MCRSSYFRTDGPSGPGPRPARGLLLLVLLALMVITAGCTVQPLVAGESGMQPLLPSTEPVIAVAPSSAVSGEIAEVAGAGWRPGEVVYINLEGQLDGVGLDATLVMTTTDDTGRFMTSFVTPLDIFWLGATDVTVVAHSIDKMRSASAPFAFATAAGTATPTPLPTLPASTPSPTVTSGVPTPLPGPTFATARVTSSGLNLRSGPSTFYPVLQVLPRGALLTVLGRDVTSTWLYVQTSTGTLGWVAWAYTDFRGTAPIVNPVNPPPTPVYRPTPVPTAVGPAWFGQYYANRFLAGNPSLVRQDPIIDFNWGYGSPAPGLPVDNFSVRWTRAMYFDEGIQRFFARSDDGVRIWVDGRLVVDEWHNMQPRTYSGDIWLNTGVHEVVVDYFENTELAYITVWWERVQPSPGFPDWKGDYFANRHLQGNPGFVRNDVAIDFDWGYGSPAPGIPNENFSVRWTRTVDFSSGDYRLYARADDGIRVFVDGNRVIDAWYDSSGDVTHKADVYLSGNHQLTVEYYQHTGRAFVQFWWERRNQPTPTATPRPNPFADANPSSGTVGTRVNLNFGAFPRNTTVYLYLGSYVRAADAEAEDAAIYASTTSDRHGAGSFQFNIPTTWSDGAPVKPGRVALLVATADFGVSASADFDVRRSQPVVAPNPYVDVNPGSGGSGTQITVQGGGFPANRSLSVNLGSVARVAAADADSPHSIVTTRSDGNGNFFATFAMPDEWSDGRTINEGKILVLVSTDDDAFEASDTFDYFIDTPNPSVSLNPSAGGTGTVVTVQGRSYPAHAAVNVYLAPLDASVGSGEVQTYASGQTDSRGRVTLSFAMPATWPNGSPVAQDTIIVTLARPDFSVSASAVYRNLTPGPAWTPTPFPTATTTPQASPTPARNPSASANPRSGSGGTTVTVSGGGFPANTTVYTHLARLDANSGNDGEYANYAVAVTTANGDYTMVFGMPTVWPNGKSISTGKLVILVATEDFSSQAAVTFNYRGVSSADVVPVPTVLPTATLPEAPPSVTPEVAPPTMTPEPATATPVSTPTERPPLATPTDSSDSGQEPTAVPAPPTAVPDPPTATPEPPTAVPDPPTATPEPPTAVPDQPTATPTATIELVPLPPSDALLPVDPAPAPPAG